MKKNKAYDKEERALMELVEGGLSQAVSDDEQQAVLSAIRNTKPKAISIRINEDDLNKIRKKADRAGLPYQTLIGAVLHRYVSGDIILKEQI